jgi:hypothetical protein
MLARFHKYFSQSNGSIVDICELAALLAPLVLYGNKTPQNQRRHHPKEWLVANARKILRGRVHVLQLQLLLLMSDV